MHEGFHTVAKATGG